jgi:hypothetical protein
MLGNEKGNSMTSAPAGNGGMTEAFLHIHAPSDNGKAAALDGRRGGIKGSHDELDGQ